MKWVALLLMAGLQAQGMIAEREVNLYIEYCSSRDHDDCSEIKVPKANKLLEQKGFKIIEDRVMPERIVIQLHDGCSPFQICPPNDYAEQATIRLQDPRTFQTYYERVVRRHVFPRTSKALMVEAIEQFNP